MRLITASLAALLIAGCASQPKDTTVSAPAAAPAASTPATPAAAPAAGTKAQTAAVKSYPGYKAKQRNGTTVYCKKLAKIGSNFADETCMTEVEMESLYDKAEQDRDAFRRNQALCGTGGCGGT